jgi:hypothetical protein
VHGVFVTIKTQQSYNRILLSCWMNIFDLFYRSFGK